MTGKNCMEKKVETTKENGRVWLQILAIITACLIPFLFGIFFSWSSPFIVKIVNDKEHYDISEEEASYFTVIPPITMIVTTIVFGNLSDIIGRKPTVLMIAVPYAVAFILAAVAKNVWVFYVSRLTCGIGDGIMLSSVPMYIGEISSPKVRGTWGNGLTFFIYFGQFAITVIGSYFSVAQTSYICLVIPVVFLVLFSFMPESPYFFVMKGKFEEAKNSLRLLTRKNNVEEDFALLKIDVERQMSESGTWKDLFTIDSNRRALSAGIFLRASQQFGGISAFATYTQYIFAKSGGSMDAQMSSIIFTSCLAIGNLVGAYTLDIFGRRLSYIVSIVCCGIILLIESIYFYIDQYQPSIDITFLNWIPITGMLVYVAFYSIGLGIVPTLMLGELFSTSIKVKGLSFLTITFGVQICVITKLFHLLASNFGLFSPFLLFSLSCFASTILAIYLVPETKGKTLEEIQQSLKGSREKK